MHNKARALNDQNILNMLVVDPNADILDLGCDDGTWTVKVVNKIKTNNIYGIEIVESSAKEAEDKGIKVKISDLNANFPFEDNSFDVIHANQIIEHIAFLDNFLSEVIRVLRPGGYVVMGTENASSWHNIFASLFGWQIFSLSNLSVKKAGLGNPFALHRGDPGASPSWTHKTVFNWRGLKEFFEAHGFTKVEIRGAGYYPLPACFGKFDPRHSHYIQIKGIKRGQAPFLKRNDACPLKST